MSLLTSLPAKSNALLYLIVYGQSEAQSTLEALNNGGGKATNVFIVMDEPCSKDLPPLCAAAIEASKEPEELEEAEDTESLTDKADPEEEADEDADVGIETDLWKKEHHRIRHNKHHHHYGHKKQKHPYENLCVVDGEFCGDNLYGCVVQGRW